MEPVFLTSLWMPIVVSAVAVYIMSAIFWMVSPHHKSDWKKLPDEEAARAALKGVPPGDYTIPHAASMEDWKSEEMMAKVKEGPYGFLTIAPGTLSMGKNLGQWFVHLLVVSTLVAYVVGRTVPAGSDYLQVFRIAGTVAFLAYSMAHIPQAIWWSHGWGRTLKDVFDGLVYGLLTAGVFGWLYPA